jgi:hypothetical protein
MHLYFLHISVPKWVKSVLEEMYLPFSGDWLQNNFIGRIDRNSRTDRTQVDPYTMGVRNRTFLLWEGDDFMINTSFMSPV